VAIGTDNKHVADDVQAIIRTFSLLDSDNYERALESVHDEFEMVTPADIASEPDTYRGPEGIRRWWESFLESMDWVRVAVEEAHELEDGRAIVEFEMQTRGRASGIETGQRAVGLASARDGKLYRLSFFTTIEQAREAAGLQPS
jgi:ketosteroid isomerase-like protein